MFHQRIRVVSGRRAVEDLDCLGERHEGKAINECCRQRIVQRALHQSARDRAAQAHLGQPLGRRVDWGQRHRKRRIRDCDARVDHLKTEVTAANFAAYPPAASRLHLLQLTRIERQPSQTEFAGVVTQGCDELATRSVGDIAAQHFALDLAWQTRPQTRDRLDTGFILVAQRQVHDQILRIH